MNFLLYMLNATAGVGILVGTLVAMSRADAIAAPRLEALSYSDVAFTFLACAVVGVVLIVNAVVYLAAPSKKEAK